MTAGAEHVVAAIDGAIHDWATSGDAMRWVPPDQRTERPGPVVPALGAITLNITFDAEPMRAALRRAAEQIAAAVQIARPHIEKALLDVAEAYARAGVIEHPAPVDPRERALHARRTRGTGPPVQQRAPRHIAPTGARR